MVKNFFTLLKNWPQMDLKLLQKIIQETAEAAGDLMIGNIIVDKIIKISKTSPQNTLEAGPSETENVGLDAKYQKKDIYNQKKGESFGNISLVKIKVKLITSWSSNRISN